MNILKSCGDRFKSMSVRSVIVLIVLMQVLLHLPFFSLPPVGQHTWRQVISLSTARNFYLEDSSLLYPRSDTRVDKNDPGYNYQEFPLIYWVLGMSYGLTGFSHAHSRILAFIFSVLLLVAVSLLLRELGVSDFRRKLTLMAMGVSPLIFYYSVNLLPNIPALTFFTAGLCFYLRSLKRPGFHLMTDLSGIILICLAVVTKATWLFYGFLLAGLFIGTFLKSNEKKKLLFKITLWAGGILLAAALQYYHQFSLHLANPWERQVIVTLGPASVTGVGHFFSILRSGIGLWFCEITLGYPVLVFFLVGIYVCFRRGFFPVTEQALFWFLWVVSAFFFSLFFFPLYQQHSYYQTHLLLPACFLAAKGIEHSLRNGRWQKAAVLLLLLSPVYMSARIMPRWLFHPQVPVELLEHSGDFQKQIPKEDLVLVVGDPTPNVYLYYLQRKGLVQNGFEPSDQSLSDFRDRGYRWFVVNDREGLREYSHPFLRLSKRVGQFRIFQILEQNSPKEAT